MMIPNMCCRIPYNHRPTRVFEHRSFCFPPLAKHFSDWFSFNQTSIKCNPESTASGPAWSSESIAKHSGAGGMSTGPLMWPHPTRDRKHSNTSPKWDSNLSHLLKLKRSVPNAWIMRGRSGEPTARRNWWRKKSVSHHCAKTWTLSSSALAAH